MKTKQQAKHDHQDLTSHIPHNPKHHEKFHQGFKKSFQGAQPQMNPISVHRRLQNRRSGR